MAIENGILFGLLVVVLWGFAKIPAKKAMGIIGPYYALFYEHLVVALVVVLGAFPFIDFAIPSRDIMLTIIAAAVIGAFGIYFLFRGMHDGKVSIVSPIAHSSAIITVLLAYIIYDEKMTLIKWVSVALLITGTMLISFKYSSLRKLRLSGVLPGVKYAFLAMILWGAFFFAIKPIVVSLGPLLAAVYVEVGVSALIAVPLIFKGLRSPGKATKYFVASGTAVAAASILFNAAIERSAVSLIYPLASSSPLITVILSYFLLEERIETNQKIAILLIIPGIIMASL
ncbi:MAG TPA: DMT family transporter [Candidatus Nanoarchaeia archaeon]|nr:DMT family transporter [Candidatus Nanoarchaeia archaeon]